MTGTITGVQCSQAANSKGFRFSRADLGGNTTRRVLVGFFWVLLVLLFFIHCDLPVQH